MSFPLLLRRRLARVGFWYLLGATLLTVLVWLAGLLAPPVGLSRSFYPALDRDVEARWVEDTTRVDLVFADSDEHGDLPSRFYRVLWQGVWFSPHRETVEFHAGADDVVVVRVDDQVVLRRNPIVGMHTASATVTLEPGAHRLVVDYRQRGGGQHLNVGWTPEGGHPQALSPTRLFLDDPGLAGYRLVVVTTELWSLVVVIWAAGVVAGASVLIGRGLWVGAHRWYRAASAVNWSDVRFRLHTLGLPALLLASVPFLIGTHTSYVLNLDEMVLPFSEMAVPWLLSVVGISWVILMIPAVLCPDRFVQVYAAALFGLAALLWVQGNLWVGDYGLLDGSAIDFEPLAWRVPYEFGLWLAVLGLSVTLYRHVGRVAPFASLLFLSLQLSVVLLGQSADRRQQWLEPPPEIYQFSSQQNVIIVVLDAFQSDVFAELVEHDRQQFDTTFNGFAYFADHASAFPTTSLSMPAMLTGQIYANDRPVRDFVRDAFGQTSVLRDLQQHGYEIDVASILSPAWVDDWFPIHDEDGSGVDAVRFAIPKPFVGVDDYRRFTARQLIELSVFRHVPHVVKRALDSDPHWFTRFFWEESADSASETRRHEAMNSQVFFSHFTDRMTVARTLPLFKLIHLGIPHRPLVVDENCNFTGVTRFTRGRYVSQARCAVEIVSSFLDRLRALGIYDQSLIVVSSDHGMSLMPRGFEGDSSNLPRFGVTPAPLSLIAGRAKALMLVKPPGGRGPLVVSEAPTAHVDLPVTILDVLGLSSSFEGPSMFERSPSESRRRHFGMYDLRQRFPRGYLDRLDLIAVEGVLDHGPAWTYERSIVSPDLTLTAKTIDLGVASATPHLGPGWSRGTTEVVDGQEVAFVFGLGRQAVAFVSLTPGRARLTARMSAGEPGQKVVEVTIDGQQLGSATLPGEVYQDIEFEIPPDPERPQVSAIIFHLPSTTDPDVPGMKFDTLSIQPI